MILRTFIVLLLGVAVMQCTEPVTKKIAFDKEVAADSINTLLDNWHLLAAKADTNYFNKMATDGVYLGTDATERWAVSDFKTWAAPYFERGNAWDFKATERHIEFGAQGKYAWFDELLETWMGTCRGSGVLFYNNGKWEIKQYNLSLMVPNPAIHEVMDVIATQQDSTAATSEEKQ